MPVVSVELPCGTRRPVMFEGVSDLRSALAACDVRTMYGACGTLITPEALVGTTKIKAVFALTPRSRAGRHSRDRIELAWTTACTAATLALLLRAIGVSISPWWLVAAAGCISAWELSLGTERCHRTAALVAIATATAAAHWDVARGSAVRLLYSAAEPHACTWEGCSLRHACSLHWNGGEYCAQLLRERVCVSLSYLLGATGFAFVWGSAQRLPTPMRALCACGVAYCIMVLGRVSGGVQWVPEPPIAD